MKTKKCCKCKKLLAIDLFGKNRSTKDGIQSCCKSCQKLYKDAHYKANKNGYIEDTKRRKELAKKKAKNYVDSLKTSCSICSEKETCCLDFHHLDPDTKLRSVSNMVASGCNKQSILKEINKCVLVCSNCHRKIHAGILKA